MKKIAFSKKLLILDYLIALIIVFFLFYCGVKNYIYISEIQRYMIETSSYISITCPYDLTALTVILSVWIGQLGVSTTAYYVMCKSDHKMQLPMELLNTMPKDIQEQLDMTTVVTSVLNSTDN